MTKAQARLKCADSPEPSLFTWMKPNLPFKSAHSQGGGGGGTCSLVPSTEISLLYIGKKVNFSVNYCLQNITFPLSMF